MPLHINIATALYHFGVRVAAPFLPKAKQWINGRKGLWERLEAKASALNGCLWMHCASVGEFEQGRPLLEALRAKQPDLPILLTFFSPSGFEAVKNTTLATHVEYLPLDSAANAKRFLATVRPTMAIFVRYEFWYDHLMALENAQVPTFLLSAIFRPSQPFFQWYGGAHRAMLRTFKWIFVQEKASLELLSGIGINNATVSGDTRFDRVAAIAASNALLPIAEAYRKAEVRPVIVAGSTWPADDALLLEALEQLTNKPRVIVAPHEFGAGSLAKIAASYPDPVAVWSELESQLELERPIARPSDLAPDEDPLNARTLLVDRMGLLSRMYKYGDIAYVGGGFGSGIHSLLEAAAWGKPVIFGPHHGSFAEAKGLIDAGAGFEVKNAKELVAVLQKLLNDPVALGAASTAASDYVQARIGATQRVLTGIQEVLSGSTSFPRKTPA